jgi:hypothetical protein
MLSASIDVETMGIVANTSTVSAPGGVIESNSANNSATDTDNLTPQADLGITTTDGIITATSGVSAIPTLSEYALVLLSMLMLVVVSRSGRGAWRQR